MYGPLFHADAPRATDTTSPCRPAAGGGRVRLSAAGADPDPAARRALRSGRAGARPPTLSGGTRRLPQDRRAASELVVGTPRPLPDGRGVVPRGRVRQGSQGVRDVPVLLSPPPDRRPRAVPAGDEL